MVNLGIAPPDPDTEVGKFRYVIGDTEYVELVPPVAGYGDYTNFSDVEIEALLAFADGSQALAIALAFAKIAAASTGESFDWKTDDLTVALSSRTGGYWDTVRFWLSLWEKEQEAEAANAFQVVFPYDHRRRGCPPELAARWHRW